MKICAVKDDVKRYTVGYLYYYETSDLYLIEVAPGLSLPEVPIFFDSFVRKDRLTVGPMWSRRYVEARVVPPDRQNIRMILQDAGLREYDPFKLLMLSRGRCSQDDCCIVPVREEPDWIVERKSRWLVQATALSGYRLYLRYRDGTSRIVPMQEPLQKERSLAILLQRREDFERVRLLGGGRVLWWGGDRYYPGADLYDQGTLMAESGDDLERILQAELVDVSDLCRQEQVSRQYVNKLLQDHGILPFKRCGRTNLYLASQVAELFDR